MEKCIYLAKDHVNATEGYLAEQVAPYETCFTDKGKLYKSLMREYGRCVGKVYIDKDGKQLSVGWVFQKRRKYDDCNKTFLQEVWATLHSAPPTRTVEYHYL